MKCLIAVAAAFVVLCSTVLAADEPIASWDDALALSTSFSVKAEPFQSAVDRLAKQVQDSLPKDSSLRFEIVVAAGDLKREGITRNLPVRDLDLKDQPLRVVLSALVQKANPDNAVKDPSEAGQIIVWVVGPHPDDPERTAILITTRPAAKERSYTLPDEFVAKEQKR